MGLGMINCTSSTWEARKDIEVAQCHCPGAGQGARGEGLRLGEGVRPDGMSCVWSTVSKAGRLDSVRQQQQQRSRSLSQACGRQGRFGTAQPARTMHTRAIRRYPYPPAAATLVHPPKAALFRLAFPCPSRLRIPNLQTPLSLPYRLSCPRTTRSPLRMTSRSSRTRTSRSWRRWQRPRRTRS